MSKLFVLMLCMEMSSGIWANSQWKNIFYHCGRIQIYCPLERIRYYVLFYEGKL